MKIFVCNKNIGSSEWFVISFLFFHLFQRCGSRILRKYIITLVYTDGQTANTSINTCVFIRESGDAKNQCGCIILRIRMLQKLFFPLFRALSSYCLHIFPQQNKNICFASIQNTPILLQFIGALHMYWRNVEMIQDLVECVNRKSLNSIFIGIVPYFWDRCNEKNSFFFHLPLKMLGDRVPRSEKKE